MDLIELILIRSGLAPAQLGMPDDDIYAAPRGIPCKAQIDAKPGRGDLRGRLPRRRHDNCTVGQQVLLNGKAGRP